ncbi:Uncharacterised protein [Halioglobus japonicus]|nr:Uncharacterised protein [Halioglobus japonicus]
MARGLGRHRLLSHTPYRYFRNNADFLAALRQPELAYIADQLERFGLLQHNPPLAGS